MECQVEFSSCDPRVYPPYVGWMKEVRDEIGDPSKLEFSSRDIRFIVGDYRLNKSTFANRFVRSFHTISFISNTTSVKTIWPKGISIDLEDYHMKPQYLYIIILDIPKTQGDW